MHPPAVRLLRSAAALAAALALARPAAAAPGLDDYKRFRALSIDEMKWLLSTTAAGEDRQGLTGDERALLYRFAFETGIRPKQIRSLTVADFDLKADPPSVTSLPSWSVSYIGRGMFPGDRMAISGGMSSAIAMARAPVSFTTRPSPS